MIRKTIPAFALILTWPAFTLAQRALPPEVALHKARVDGKYCMLLAQIPAPQDAKEHGDFFDLGKVEKRTDARPAGHHVYVFPYWYVWAEEVTRMRTVPRRWAPEQVAGKPDTKHPGDVPTAWASLTPDSEDEWLLLEYEKPVIPRMILVHETYKPGALWRVTAFRLTGEEVELWKGIDPTPVSAEQGVSKIKSELTFKTNRIRIYLKSTEIEGWNEVDAVGLRDSGGVVHWAKYVRASSTYAEPKRVKAK